MERDTPTPLLPRSDLESFRLAIKADLARVKLELEAYREELRLQLELTRSSLTLRFGCMLIFGLSMFFAALKLTGP